MQKVNVITPWYQEEVDMLVKSMADAMDKTILDLILKGENKMTNVMAELQYALDGFGYKWEDIEWSVIKLELGGFNTKKALLKPDYSNQDLEQFKKDVTSLGQYEQGGRQELYGDVVFKDGTWLSREGYDGSEWWHYNIKPTYEAHIKDLSRN